MLQPEPKGKENEVLPNTVVFISNSELDGFREGDGDLMDKLANSLNNTYRIQAIRIIQSMDNVPNDKKELIDKKQLISLSASSCTDAEMLRESFLRIIDEDYKSKNKIVYIGSRINIKGGKKEELGESGSLFNKKLIANLKKRNVKIVVCCLEYLFFKRAVKHLRRAYEMMIQQLFLADKIQFLTAPDKKDFDQTMDYLQGNKVNNYPQILKAHPLAEKWLTDEIKTIDQRINSRDQIISIEKDKINNLQKEYDRLKIELNACKISSEKQNFQRKMIFIKMKIKEIKGKEEYISLLDKNDNDNKAIENLKTLASNIQKLNFSLSGDINYLEHKEKAVFISGIYTVDPLTDEEIIKMGPNDNNNILSPIDILKRRPNNILQFGMIRGEKGIDEAIRLSALFQKEKCSSKVIISGKLMIDLGMVFNIFQKIFNIAPHEFYQQLQLTFNDYYSQETKAITVKEARNFKQLEDLMERKSTCENKYESFNIFCDKLFQDFKTKFSQHGQNIEVHFNAPEFKIKELAMQCRYAIKLDHKGMANNASTIVSCLGLFLPVITMKGLITNDEFVNFELAEEPKHERYSSTVIMPKEEYEVDAQGEVRPVKPTIQQIFDFIISPVQEERYSIRLEALMQLRNEGIFKCDNVALQLINLILLPLSNSVSITSSSFSSSESSSSSSGSFLAS